MSITDFLNARIAEDEIRAQQASPHSYGDTFANDNYGWLLIQPARVLAECAAKRAIVEDVTHSDEDTRDYVIRTLAAVYADHPAYLDEWRVGV